MTPDELRSSLHADFIKQQREQRNTARSDAENAAELAHLDEQHEVWRKAHILTYADLKNLPPPTPLLGDLLYQGTTAWLAGSWASYKSFFAIDWALSVVTGKPWQGYAASKGPVAYISGEGLSGMPQRIDAWLSHRRLPSSSLDDLAILADGESLLDPLVQYHLARELEEGNFKLLVLDTQARVTPGANENDKHEMDKFIGYITRLAKNTRTTVLTVHHSPKGLSSLLRGTGSLEGAADTILSLTKSEDNSYCVDLKVSKQKDGESGKTLRYFMQKCEDSLVIGGLNSGSAPF